MCHLMLQLGSVILRSPFTSGPKGRRTVREPPAAAPSGYIQQSKPGHNLTFSKMHNSLSPLFLSPLPSYLPSTGSRSVSLSNSFTCLLLIYIPFPHLSQVIPLMNLLYFKAHHSTYFPTIYSSFIQLIKVEHEYMFNPNSNSPE